MDCKFKIDRPDEVQMTLTVTMSLSSWKRLKAAMIDDNSHPAWELKSKIDEMVDLADEKFTPKKEPAR